MDENGKLICEKIVSFDSVPRRLWIRFEDEVEYSEKQDMMLSMLSVSDGHDNVIVYCTAENKRIPLPNSRNVKITAELLAQLRAVFGEKNVETT